MNTIKMQHDGVYEKTYHILKPEQVCIEVMENVVATCVITLQGDRIEIEKKIVMHKGSTLHIVYKSEGKALISKEVATLHENARLNVGYFEVNDSDCDIDAHYDLLERDAHVNIITTTYARQKKRFHIVCTHTHAQTYSNMENYAINDVNGKLDIVASGNIVKGARGSKSHQHTRVLTLADKESVKVTPLLLIDENDVEASHACGIGEMNEDHLFYLQTRGLNKRQALGLLTLSYVLPILKIVEHEEALKQALEAEIQSKVGLS